jgi:hypothetical protein
MHVITRSILSEAKSKNATKRSSMINNEIASHAPSEKRGAPSESARDDGNIEQVLHKTFQ